MPHLYFAYGSNLDLDQMRSRCPGSRLVGPAALPNHRLAFAGFSPRWGGGVATIVPQKKGVLYGALYELNPSDVERLDSFEGCPVSYRRCRKVILDEDTRRRVAYVYIKTEADLAPPSASYFNQISRAYRAFGFDRSALRRATMRLQ